ncbi:MAG: hypothetical protein ABW278_02600, partial [Steroidobacteraceae bacterium]
MPHQCFMRRAHGAGITGALGVLVILPAHGAGAPADAQAGWAAVAGCARQLVERTRHICLDQVLRDAGLLDSGASTAQPETASAPAAVTSPASSASSASAPPPQAAVPGVPPTAKRTDPQNTVIATVSSTADGRYIITTREGTVWRQTERLPLPRPPVAGDPIRVRNGSMGS